MPNETCYLCGRTVPLEAHHKIFRSQGGTDDPENLVDICRVCHGAAHGVLYVDNGFSCKNCSMREKFGCYIGERLLGLPLTTDPPWEGA